MRNPKRLLRRRAKLLGSELRRLQSYKIDIDLLSEEYKAEFHRDMSYIEKMLPQQQPPETDLASPPPSKDSLVFDPMDSGGWQRWKKTEDGWEKEAASSPSSQSDEEPANDPPPPWAKKLYKKIALASHPDRTLQDTRKEKLSKIFADSAQAIKDGNYQELVGYALELDIDVLDGDVDAVPLIQGRIESLKKEIADIEGSLEWLWGEHFGVSAVRTKIAVGYFSKKGLHVKSDDIASIILKLEDDNEPG